MLTGDLTVAAPMRSGNAYTLKILIWDKKGKGSITAKMDFKIIPNGQIRLETNKISFSEIYIFSKERDAVVTDNKIKFNENIYIIFEGCSGLKEIEGQVFPGLGIMISDQDGKKVLDYQDLFADSNDSGFGASNVKTRISSHITIPPMELKNPLHCNLTVWDKKSDSSGKISTDLTID
jgi:hypothetical protein